MTNVQPLTNQPTSIRKQGDQTILIIWGDGHQSQYSFRYLRQCCPCAACIDEWTNEKRLESESVPLDLGGLKIDPVGTYALSFSFSDNHNTGIYHFNYLREICPCDFCRNE